jgi:hypothetical protein
MVSFDNKTVCVCGSESVKDATDGVAGMIRAQGRQAAHPPTHTYSHVRLYFRSR